MSFAAMMLVAMVLDLAFGWPNPIYARIGHPVTWLGRLVGSLDRRLNRGEADTPRAGRLRGIVAAAAVILAAALPAIAVQAALPDGWIGILIGGVLAWPLVAMRSMHEHVAAVEAPLWRGDLDAARHAVSMIVGRDPRQLDRAGVARSALESLAENTSDGIVAPVFWGAVAGLPGIAAYKAINTLDSMIGHRTPRFLHFGWASARIDDVVNLIPARLTGFIFALSSWRPAVSLRCMARDARKHRSPNAGWPEAAMAGALGVRLSGPRIYDGKLSNEPWVNAGSADPDASGLARGLALYRRGMFSLAVLLALAALI